ncbi:MAG: hypothetical protein PHV06_04290 [bacterium]|nr:hypothetical protein [bacterium]
MNESKIAKKKIEILELVEEKKITPEEALEMLESLALYEEQKSFKKEMNSKKKEKFVELF